MKSLFCLGLLVAAFIGCSKHKPPAIENQPPESSAVTETPASSELPRSPRPAAVNPPPQPVARGNSLAGRVDAHMTALLKRFVALKGRSPKASWNLPAQLRMDFPSRRPATSTRSTRQPRK